GAGFGGSEALCGGEELCGAVYVRLGAGEGEVLETTAAATRGAGLGPACTTGRATRCALHAAVTSARSSGASGAPPASAGGMTVSSVPADSTAGATNSLELGDFVVCPRAKKQTNRVTTPAACQARGWLKIGRSWPIAR